MTAPSGQGRHGSEVGQQPLHPHDLGGLAGVGVLGQLEVFSIDDPLLDEAKKVRMGTFNAQSQPSYDG